MIEDENLDDAIEWNDGNDPIEPERFSRKSLIFLAAAICFFIGITFFQWLNKPTDAVYEKQENVILRDANFVKINVRIKYRFTGSAGDVKACSPAGIIEENSLYALILAGIKFNTKDFLSNQQKFVDEFTKVFKKEIGVHAGICRRAAPEILDIKIESDFFKNIV